MSAFQELVGRNLFSKKTLNDGPLVKVILNPLLSTPPFKIHRRDHHIV